MVLLPFFTQPRLTGSSTARARSCSTARRGIPTPGLARVMLAARIAVTLMANILAGVAYGLLGAVVAAWPALALVGSYELLMIMIRRARSAAPEAMADVAEAVSIPALDEAAGTVPLDNADAVPTPVPEIAAKTVTPGRARRRPVNTHARNAEREYAADLAEGRLPSLRAVMRDVGVGQDKAREVRHTSRHSRRPTGRRHGEPHRPRYRAAISTDVILAGLCMPGAPGAPPATAPAANPLSTAATLAGAGGPGLEAVRVDRRPLDERPRRRPRRCWPSSGHCKARHDVVLALVLMEGFLAWTDLILEPQRQ